MDVSNPSSFQRQSLLACSLSLSLEKHLQVAIMQSQVLPMRYYFRGDIDALLDKLFPDCKDCEIEASETLDRLSVMAIS